MQDRWTNACVVANSFETSWHVCFSVNGAVWSCFGCWCQAHWSLAIVCNPGKLLAPPGAETEVGEAAGVTPDDNSARASTPASFETSDYRKECASDQNASSVSDTPLGGTAATVDDDGE